MGGGGGGGRGAEGYIQLKIVALALTIFSWKLTRFEEQMFYITALSQVIYIKFKCIVCA